jgi:hypothetical protein
MLTAGVVALLVAWAAPQEPPSPRVPAGAARTAEARAGAPHLIRRSDGGYEHRDRAAGFAATIHPDGRVTMRDLAPIAVESPKVLGFDLSGKPSRSAYDKFNEHPNTLVHRGTTPDSKHDLLVNWGPYGAPPIPLSAGGSIGGLADIASATRRATAKREFLERTAPLRERLEAEHRREAETAALVRLEAELRAIWSDESQPLAARKRRLFQRWDECAEAPPKAAAPPTSDERARTRAGVQARRRIEAFIRTSAPHGTRDGYSAAELRRLNDRRHSRARFDPYAQEQTALGPAPPPS